MEVNCQIIYNIGEFMEGGGDGGYRTKKLGQKPQNKSHHVFIL
jgi:hypothetical protein